MTDSTGAVVPGATVVLTNEATQFSRQAVTDSEGSYFFGAVERGNYTLRVELTGFSSYQATGIEIASNATASLDVQLQVGEQTEVVEVTATRDLLQTETGAREGLITPEAIEKLSIIGRNPTELLRILPGVVSPDQSSFEISGITGGFGGTGQSFSINGARPEQLGITLDGANLRDIGNNSGMMNVPNNEFVSEVKVQTSNYAAEFGTQAVSIQAVTKSGSSEFHGSAYYYTRRHELAANDRSRSLAGNPKPESKFDYPGFTLSGPLVLPGFNENRDKAFFFVGFELAKQAVDEGTAFGTTPTAGQRVGDFNSTIGGQNLNQPTTVNIPSGFPGAGTPAPNNDLSPYMTPLGQALINLYPDPNFNDPDNRYNYIFSELAQRDRSQVVGRLDFNLSDSTKLYVRYARDKDTSERFRGLWWNVTNLASPTPLDATQEGMSAVANITSVLSPTTTNEFIFSWSRLRNDNMWQDPAVMQLATYGIAPADFSNPFGASPYIPDVVASFNGERSLWYAQDVENIFAYNGFLRFADNFTKVLNTHAIKAGVVVERQYKTQNFQHQNNVQLNFAPWGFGTTGSDFGDLLAGRPASANIGEPSAIGDFHAWNLEAYLQDSWKVTRNFTLEYGLRFGKWTNNAEINDLGAIFSPSAYDPNAGLFVDAERSRANGFLYAAQGDVDRSLRGDRPLLWMPRVNFAWDLKGDGDIVARGGYGIFYVREQGNAQYDIINLPPNSYAASLDAGSLQNAFGGQGLRYNTLGLVDPFNSLNAFDANGLSPFNLEWPKTTNASFSIAKRIPWRQTIEVGYVGSWGRNLTSQLQQNILQPGTLSSGVIGGADLSNPVHRAALDGSVVDSFRPFPAYNNVRFNENLGRTNYHSLQATLSRQSGDFQYLLSYTLGRNYGTVANDNGGIDPIEPERSEGIVRTDRRHIVNFSWSWRLGAPFDSGLGAVLLNDWNLSGISTYFSGTPIRIGFSNGDLNTAQMERAWYGTEDYQDYNVNGANSLGPITPTYSCDPRLSANEVGESILDIGCIGIPEFPNSGPIAPTYDTRSPARSFHDLTVFKDFQLGGSKRLQLRFSAFNLFNQAYPDPLQNDIDLVLDTECSVTVTGVPNGAGGTMDVCDPTGGFQFTEQTRQNFGNIITKRGHRVIELAARFFF